MALDRLQSRLQDYLAHHRSGPSVGSVGSLVVLTGGRASSLYTFEYDESGHGPARTSVLKIYAPGRRGREHATREWRALTHLRVMNRRVPRVTIFESDDRYLGHPFIVMDHISGTLFWRAFEVADLAARARLTESFVEQLVALHGLDPHLLEPAAVPPGSHGYMERELEQLRRDNASLPHTGTAEIIQWLDQRKQSTPCERAVILHRDYHPWNVVVDAVERLWVIDWDWRIGDARFDVAWTCTLMRRSSFHAFSNSFRDEYARQSGLSLDEFAYFEVLVTVRWLLNVLPPTGADVVLDAAARKDFREFLVEPVRRAQILLQERTGITVGVQM